MKLISLKIEKADTCGGLLDGLYIPFREEAVDINKFDPICLIGPNGAGKSQLLQIIAEIFQSVFAYFTPNEETGKANNEILFELKYKIKNAKSNFEYVSISRLHVDKKKPTLKVNKFIDGSWLSVDDDEVISLLPSKVVGYTSGENETLSIPFFVSRAGYASQVGKNATKPELKSKPIPDSRMLLIDYGTNLEVLVANLLLNTLKVRSSLIKEPNLKALRSFRCVIQLNHSSAPSNGVKLTDELDNYISYLKKCATCYDHELETNTHIFDFFVQDATHKAFNKFWKEGALELYSCFHKLAMLNDLIISKKDRDAYEKGVIERRFASRLPEPMERQKVFRFERVEFLSDKKQDSQVVDYVSLSDGEHQLAQLIGTFCMVNYPNVLFLLDEPESHFNPRWRIEFISKLLSLPTSGGGSRQVEGNAASQECLITTHSPFVPSDMRSENVLIFKKNEVSRKIEVRHPSIETYGSRFDTILADCFEISPPISDLSREFIENLIIKGTEEQIQKALSEVGESTLRMRLAGRLSQLQEK